MLACHMCLCIRHLELLFTHFKPRDYEAKKVYCGGGGGGIKQYNCGGGGGGKIKK